MANAKAAAQDFIVQEIDIAAPPERVFQALTDAAQLKEWWGKEPSVELHRFEMDARKGGRWGFDCSPIAGHEHGEHIQQLERNQASKFEVHGEILEYDPPRLLVWSWIANWHEHPSTPTTVRWELTPTKTGTHVRLTHSGLAAEPTSRKDYGAGWAGVLKLLNNYFGSQAAQMISTKSSG
jgi:uncharacterized protein YndB with AHSA1/START domain